MLYLLKSLLWKSFAVVIFTALPFFEVLAKGGASNAGGGGASNRGDGGASNTQGISLENPLNPKFSSLPDFLTAFLDILIKISFPFIVLAVIYTGFLFVKAQGNPDELRIAKTAFFWTVIGSLIILGASAILALVQGTVSNLTLL